MMDRMRGNESIANAEQALGIVFFFIWNMLVARVCMQGVIQAPYNYVEQF